MNSQKSNAGLWAAVIGGVAAVGGIAAAAALGGKKHAPNSSGMRGAAGRRFVPKKPCGCGR